MQRGTLIAPRGSMVDTTTSPKRLLVVDDDRLICWALGREFAPHGLAVSCCHDGKDALDCVRAGGCDLAILDVNLPDTNGIALLGEIRKIAPGTRAVVMSADADAAVVRRAIAAGADRFVEKPFDPSAFRAHVISMLRDYPVARRHPRHPCRFPVRISLLAPLPAGAGPGIDRLDGVAEDVGAGGYRIATEFPLASGQVVRVTAGRDNAVDPFLDLVPPHATAEVRWATMAPGGFQAGLGFTGPPDRPGLSTGAAG